MGRPNKLNQTIIKQTTRDLVEDFGELWYLATDARKKLQTFTGGLRKHKNHILPQTRTSLLEAIASLDRHYISLLQAIQEHKETDKSISEQIVAKTVIKDQLRMLQGILGTTLTATDWQSPSFDHSVHSEAGVQTGKIYATRNDYKRDQHWDAIQYEQLFKKEYIDAPFKLPINVYLTQSGMGAFTTTLMFLTLEQHIRGPILMGTGVYFQNKDLLKKHFGEFAIEVNEMDLHAAEQAIRQYKPKVLFFDTLGNTHDLVLPNIEKLLRIIAKYATRSTYVVLDNTCLCVQYQPLKHTIIKHPNIHLIVLESLNKYYQFGMDRTTAGIVWGMGKDIGKLFDYRENLGVHILDSSVHILPTPNRKLLTRRLKRFTRNANILANTLNTALSHIRSSKVKAVQYPGEGSCITFMWKTGFARVPVYKRFMALVLQEAKKEKINIVGGSSFGLDTTRVYLTALRAETTIPFIRIAVGTETIGEIEAIARVILTAITKL